MSGYQRGQLSMDAQQHLGPAPSSNATFDDFSGPRHFRRYYTNTTLVQCSSNTTPAPHQPHATLFVFGQHLGPARGVLPGQREAWLDHLLPLLPSLNPHHTNTTLLQCGVDATLV